MLKWKRTSDPNGNDSDFIAHLNLVANNVRVVYPSLHVKVTKRGTNWYFGIWHRYKTYNIPFVDCIVPFKSMRAAKEAATKELESFCKAVQS